MHTYKSIYTYTYMLCANRFVVIFVVIVWKTTLNTRKKLKRDYLRRLFERTIWGKPFEKNHLRGIIWEEGDGAEIFDKRRRDGILRQTARLLRISINKTCLFVHVLPQPPQYPVPSPLIKYFSPAPSLSNGLPQMIPSKWSPSNGLPQMVSSNNPRK